MRGRRLNCIRLQLVLILSSRLVLHVQKVFSIPPLPVHQETMYKTFKKNLISDNHSLKIENFIDFKFYNIAKKNYAEYTAYIIESHLNNFQMIYPTISAVDRLAESLRIATISAEGGKACLSETLNAVRLLTRLAPLIYEDIEWIGFFHSKIPNDNGEGTQSKTLAEKMIEVLKFVKKIPKDNLLSYLSKRTLKTSA